MIMVPAAVRLIMKKGMSWLPGPGNPEKTAHMSPPRKGPSARTPLARLCAVPFTAPLLDGGANLLTMACKCTTNIQQGKLRLCSQFPFQRLCVCMAACKHGRCITVHARHTDNGKVRWSLKIRLRTPESAELPNTLMFSHASWNQSPHHACGEAELLDTGLEDQDECQRDDDA